MNSPELNSSWADQLAEFLKSSPGINAVRVDPLAHKVSLAVLGDIDTTRLEAALIETITAIEAKLIANKSAHAPGGYLIKREGSAVVIGRQSCSTAEKLWVWREMKWPEISAPHKSEDHEWKLLAIMALGCGIAGIAGLLTEHIFPALVWLSKGLFLIGVLCGGWDAAKDTYENLKNKDIDIHFLMLAVALGAIFIGAWGEAVLLLFLFSASGAMEEYSLYRTQREVGSLLKSAPKQACIINTQGIESEITIDLIKFGDTLRVKPGEAFAADGTVLTGKSASDESALTGEAVPVPKLTGDLVYSGTINLWGTVDFQVTKLPSESTLQRIIRLIQSAQKLKAPSERFIDKFGTRYTYFVICAATAMFLVWWLGFKLPAFDNEGGTRSAFYRAMTLMVVASPCALVLSIPSAILASIAWGAKHGILFRGGAAIESLADITAVALDKTGTLTTGDLAVIGCESFPAGKENQILEIAYSLENKSHHPIARAIVKYAKLHNVREIKLEEFESLTGQGLRAKAEGSTLVLGRRELLNAGPLAAWSKQLPQAPADLSEVWVIGKDLVGRILLKDQIRMESKFVLAQLKASGVRTIMLTGDRSHSAESVARELGIDEFRSGLSPEGKVEALQDLKKQGYTIAMVGDGVNDAPSLAAADVSIAMGARGSDAALEEAEVILMHDRIENFLQARLLSIRARKVIRQNLTLSLSVVAIMVIATTLGVVPLAFGVAAHEGSTVIVCLNSLRLLFGKNSQLLRFIF
jgi:Cd2+/Zn2+-exporting ATPase